MIKLSDIINERDLSAKEEKIVKALKKTGKFKKDDPAMYAIAASKAESLNNEGDTNTPLNENISIDVPEDTPYTEFAIEVAKILKEGYGKHNYKPFIEALVKELKNEE